MDITWSWNWEPASFLHKKISKPDFLLTLLKNNIFLSSEDANILKSYKMQYSKQAHKILAPPDKKTAIFYLDKSVFKNLLWENKSRSPFFIAK